MKALKTLLVTGATLAFIAPAAHASLDSTATPRVKAKAVKALTGHRNGHHLVGAASKASSGGDGPLYIIWTSPLGSQTPVANGGDCESTGNNCSPAELCSYWGENCDQVDASQPMDSQPAASQPAAVTVAATDSQPSAASQPAADNQTADSQSTDPNSDEC